MATKDKTVLVRFIVERETKGTFRYREVAEEGKEAIGVLYVKKATLAQFGTAPKALEVRIAAVE